MAMSVDFLLGHMRQKLPMSDKVGNAIIEHLVAYCDMLKEKEILGQHKAVASAMVKAFGPKEQGLHVTQELGEFIAIFSKFLSGDVTWFRVAEECDDAMWMLEQVSLIVQEIALLTHGSFDIACIDKRRKTVQTLKERLVDYYAVNSAKSETPDGKFELP